MTIATEMEKTSNTHAAVHTHTTNFKEGLVGLSSCLSISTKEDHFSVSIQPAIGELFLPITMTELDFRKEQGELSYSVNYKKYHNHYLTQSD